MKKSIAIILAAASVFSAAALPKAIYVKQGDTYTKYNLGVAGGLNFSNGGKTLDITGYAESINLDNIDYITFTAPVQQSLTPSEHKARMISIGEEINKRIDLYNVQDALHMYECFTRSNEANGWKSYSQYAVPQEYWDVFNEFGENVMQAAAGNISFLAKVRAGATNLYKFEDYTGIYNANSVTRTWERIATADYFEMRFRADDGENYIVRLTPSKDFTSYVTPDYRGRLPRTIDILLAKGNTTIASGRMKSELKQDECIAFDTEMTCGKYTAHEIMKIVNNKITSDITVTVAGEKFATINRDVAGKNLLVYDEMYDAFHNASHWHDEDDNCMGQDYDALTAHFIRANASADVLGLLQTRFKGFGFNKIYSNLSKTESCPYERYYLDDTRYINACGKLLTANSDNSYLSITAYDIDFYKDFEKYLNNYADATFHYDRKPQIQGYISFETLEDFWEDQPWYNQTDNFTGFTVVDGLLVYVTRDIIRDGGNTTYGPWHYTICDEENWDNSTDVEVADSKVIYPKVIKYIDYSVSPILTFPDQTSFAFEDFFDETSFKTLINDYEDIISTYDTIVGRDRDDE